MLLRPGISTFFLPPRAGTWTHRRCGGVSGIKTQPLQRESRSRGCRRRAGDAGGLAMRSRGCQMGIDKCMTVVSSLRNARQESPGIWRTLWSGGVSGMRAPGSLGRWLTDRAIMIPRATGTKETVKSISFSFRVLSDVFDHSISVYSSVRFATFKAPFDAVVYFSGVPRTLRVCRRWIICHPPQPTDWIPLALGALWRWLHPFSKEFKFVWKYFCYHFPLFCRQCCFVLPGIINHSLSGDAHGCVGKVGAGKKWAPLCNPKYGIPRAIKAAWELAVR